MKIGDGVVIFLAVLFAIAFLLLVIMLINYFEKFKREKQRIIAEMNSTDNENAYIEKRKELRCHYLCLIPFVTKRNVAKVYNVFFRTEEHEKTEKRGDGFLHVIVPSIVGGCLCAVCLCGVSWAWFTASVSTGTSSIRTPEYELTVSVTDSDNNPLSATDDKYTLSSGTTYTVTLSAVGTDGATGFCKVEIGEAEYYTEQISAEGSMAFTVTAQVGTEITFTLKWGSCAVRTDENKIAAGNKVVIAETVSVES